MLVRVIELISGMFYPALPLTAGFHEALLVGERLSNYCAVLELDFGAFSSIRVFCIKMLI